MERIALVTGSGRGIGFARHVAAEAGPHGIGVNVVAPGPVRTEGSAAARTPEAEARAGARSVLNRMLEPEDVASVVASVVGSGFAGVAGTRIPVDAGYRVLSAP